MKRCAVEHLTSTR